MVHLVVRHLHRSHWCPLGCLRQSKLGWGLWEQSPLSPQDSVNLEPPPPSPAKPSRQVIGQRSGRRSSQSALLPEQSQWASRTVDALQCLTPGEEAATELFQLSFVDLKRQNVEQGRLDT